jgi:hypothetical protein
MKAEFLPFLVLWSLPHLCACAQINYLSGGGNVSAYGTGGGGVSPGYQLISYSGDWAYSATASFSPAGFSAGVSGAATASFTNSLPPYGTAAGEWANSAGVSFSPSDQQITCHAGVQYWFWNGYPGSTGPIFSFLNGNASASGSLSFSVSSPVPYTITWYGLEWVGGFSLSSANRGTLLAKGGWYGSASGDLAPGDIYTLSIISSVNGFPPSSGNLEREDIYVTLTVPEPSAASLAAVVLTVACLRRARVRILSRGSPRKSIRKMVQLGATWCKRAGLGQ